MQLTAPASAVTTVQHAGGVPGLLRCEGMHHILTCSDATASDMPAPVPVPVPAPALMPAIVLCLRCCLRCCQCLCWCLTLLPWRWTAALLGSSSAKRPLMSADGVREPLASVKSGAGHGTAVTAMVAVHRRNDAAWRTRSPCYCIHAHTVFSRIPSGIGIGRDTGCSAAGATLPCWPGCLCAHLSHVAPERVLHVQRGAA